MKPLSAHGRHLANLPIFASATLAALWVWYFHATAAATPLFLGIIAGGLVDLDNRLTGRLRNVFFTLLHFSAASLLVQSALGHSGWLTLLLTVAAFGVTLAGALDIRYRTIAFGTLLVMMYTVLSHMPHIDWYFNPLMIVCGTLLYSLCTLVLHLLLPHRPVQENMARAYRRLADYMMAKAQFFDPDEAAFLSEKEVALALKNSSLIDAFNQCRSALYYRLRSQHRHPRTVRLLQYYLAAQNMHERISSRHVDYAEFARLLAHSDLIYRIQRLIVLQAQACSHMAEALHTDTDFVCDASLARAGQGLSAALALAGDTANPALQQLVGNILAISDQLQQLQNVRLGDMADGEAVRIAGQDLERPGEMWRVLRSHWNLESSVFRHAVRMALISAVGGLLVAGLNWHFGYWILLTALIVCQPNYSATTSRLKQRILGTVLGVVVGSLLPYFTPSLGSQLAVMVASSTLFFIFRTARYSFSTFFITIQVLAGFALIGVDTHAAMASRIIDTLMGAALAWVAVAYLWPDWRYLTLGKTGVRALHGNGAYLQHILHQLQHGHADDVDYRLARRIAHERAVALGNTVSDMSIEPKKYATELPAALSLLQRNHAIISTLSALGALRGQLPTPTPVDSALPSLWHVGDLLAGLMCTTDTRRATEFQAALNQANTHLSAIRPQLDPSQPQQHIVWAQLQCLSEQLPAYFHTLCACLDQDCGNTPSNPDQRLPSTL